MNGDILSITLNPHIVLQAQDHAHRIGQTKEIQVFRFCTKYTTEEKVIEKAYKKLALDALVIQHGRLAEQKNGLLQMERFGAEMVFSSKDRTITDEDIDRIAKGEEGTTELDAKMKTMTEDAIKFKMDDTSDLHDFDDEKGWSKIGFIDAMNVDPDHYSRILDACQELKIPSPVLDMIPSYFGIRLAALASRKEFMDLENWLSNKLVAYKDDFYEVEKDTMFGMLKG